MGLLDKLTAPLKGLEEWRREQQRQQREKRRLEEEEIRAVRAAYWKDIQEEFANADRLQPKRYRELTVGESKVTKPPAVDYFLSTGAVHLYNLLPPDQMATAQVVDALGIPHEELEADPEAPHLIDVKPKDAPSVEHGVVNLGPVPEMVNASGQRWVYYLELTYPGAARGRAGVLIKRFVIDTTL